MAEGDKYWTTRGREIRLGPPVKGAGGGVFSVPLSQEVVAVLHEDGSDPVARERRIEAMLKKPPALPDIVEDGLRFTRTDWPLATLHDRSRKFAGYLRSALDLTATSPLEHVLRERKARAEGLPTSLGAKINLAARLAVAITELHQLDHRVVYLSPANLRFYRQSLHVALMGSERFSIRASLERFAASPGPEGINAHYIAPEFQGKTIPAGKEEAQDRFALAVIVFQLLNYGIHPFDGLPTRDDVPEDIPARIAGNYYAYGPKQHPALEPDPDSGHLAMPKEFRAMFHRAFGNDGTARPPALDWAAWLQFYSIPSNSRVVVCGVNPTHHHYAELPCAACARDPLPPAPPAEAEEAPDPNRAVFEARDTPFVPIEHAFPPANRFPPAKPPPMATRWAPQLTFPQTIGLLALLFLGIAFLVSRAPAPEAEEHASVARPAEAPPPPPKDPFLALNPEMQRAEAETEGYVTAAAQAIASDERTEWQRALLNLHTDAPEHEPVPPNAWQPAFADYAARLSPDHFDEGKRQLLLKELHKVLMGNPFDDVAAWELGWLNLVGGRRDEAKALFLHAIWVNPDRAEAWYGLGIIGADDPQKIGALATAELVTTDQEKIAMLRNTFPPLLLKLCSVKPNQFAVLQGKARELADKYRPYVASPKYE